MHKLGRPRKPKDELAEDVEQVERLREYIERCGGKRSLLHGWVAYTEYRREGWTAGTYDVYFRSPDGKRFRSKADIARFFNLDVAAVSKAKPSLRAPAASDATAYAVPPPVRPSKFSHGTILHGSDGRSRWQVAPRHDTNGLVEWECVDRAGLPLESRQTQKRKLLAAPAPKQPAARRRTQDIAPDAGSFVAASHSELLAWVCCDSCGKWRSVARAPVGTAAWYCSMHPDPMLSRCDAPAEAAAGAAEEADADEEVEAMWGVERLLGRRGAGRTVRYLVRWSGYDEGTDSWESVANICDPALILAFEEDMLRLGTTEALREEGLSLVRSGNTNGTGTGYAGVRRLADGQRFACTSRSGKFLGEFPSAEAAAHAYARDIGPTGEAATAGGGRRRGGGAAAQDGDGAAAASGSAASAAAAGVAAADASVADTATASVQPAEPAEPAQPVGEAAGGACMLSELERQRARNVAENERVRRQMGLGEEIVSRRRQMGLGEEALATTTPAAGGKGTEAKGSTEAAEAAEAVVEAAVEAMLAQLEREAAATAAVRCAKEEGLTLVAVDTLSGYHNVTVVTNRAGSRYKALSRRQGKPVVLGVFSTGEEAALCVARHLGPAKSRQVYESMADHLRNADAPFVPIRLAKPLAATLLVSADGSVQLRLRQRKPGGKRQRDARIAKHQIETFLDGPTWVGSEPSHSAGAATGLEDDAAPKRAARRAASSTRPTDLAVAVHGRLACPAYMAALHEQSAPRKPSEGGLSRTAELSHSRASLLPVTRGKLPVRRPATAPAPVVPVGPAFQARVDPGRLVSSSSAGPPPRCGCGKLATWTGRYAVCSTGGCAFLAEMPPDPLTPICGCGRPCVWARRRWWCSQWGAAGGDGCGFEGIAHAPHASPTAISQSELSRAAAADTAAMLTASAFGVSTWGFVAPSDCGLGLYARQVTPRHPRPRRPLTALSPSSPPSHHLLAILSPHPTLARHRALPRPVPSRRVRACTTSRGAGPTGRTGHL